MSGYNEQEENLTPESMRTIHGPILEIDPLLLESCANVLSSGATHFEKIRTIIFLSSLGMQFAARLELAKHAETPFSYGELYSTFVNHHYTRAEPDEVDKMRKLSDRWFYEGRRTSSIAVCALAGIEPRIVDRRSDIKHYPELFESSAEEGSILPVTMTFLGQDTALTVYEPFDIINRARRSMMFGASRSAA